MQNFCRIILTAILSITVLMLITPETLSAEIDDTIRKTFTVESGGTLTVDTDLGSLKVRGSSGSALDIEVIREVRTSSRKKAQQILDDFKVDFEQNGRNVTVTGERKRKANFWDKIWNRLRVQYIIHIPDIYNVDLKTRGGSISVDSLEGEVNIRTSGGSLKLDNITGPVWGKTSGGSIRVGDVEGDVDVNTSGGSIKIERAWGTVRAHTSGGGITVNEVMGTIDADTSGGSIKAAISRQPESDCRLSTSGGSVTVYLDPGIAVDLDASTSGGRVHTDIPLTVKGEINKRKLKSKINGGGPLLYLHTSGGSIYIKEF